MRDVVLRVLDPFFGHPRGLPGRLGGALMARSNARSERHLVALAALRPTDSVLVVGPGPGVGLAEAARVANRGHVVGVDPSEEMLDRCRQRCADLIRTGRVELRRGTAEDTGAADASVDVVLSVNNVVFWSDRAAGLAELRRVLRPGGLLVLSMHRTALDAQGLTAERLRADVEAAGLAEVVVRERPGATAWGPAVDLTARRR
ncbi:Methyltransferase domain-containing protein [Streptoalloteichus tenebrarius]|uniref:Methyltransferase domain-containing protein n=1 Tax=Streptoalloteichus tenebrarius (strain ATCC 17920 / DSM 40477 / JCM 4838 / CBS 697.72 / NBRC 16177 / NCIMB 11028 / NRRL B-12390 / A12253. 1 / ISP 5477) TaxID=1933 RepID=A0ABT1HZA0_STRSD|nr:class I SAM-dependent methyltransferase [Streptoalloteichus tenebrarius]MCP2260820.1 Methyltransferase domain-containing protein [Streptoalloteichus tenebrarius]BFF00506.1 class I SAM-dependent methyltransferase [Streptoalloteichus tenebrarius]